MFDAGTLEITSGKLQIGADEYEKGLAALPFYRSS
jgi:hypothetical protein